MPAIRDDKGRFIKGSTASPGRTKRVVEVKFHDLLLEQVTPQVWSGIVRKAIMSALQGDRYARQFIADYTLGKAPQILELRAGDAAMLAELLKRFEAEGLSAGDVFALMIAQFAEVDSEGEQDG